MASITMVGSGSTGKGTPSSTTRCYPRPQCRNHPVPARIGFSRAASLTRSSASVRGVGGREAHRIKPTTSRASVFRGTIWTFSGTSAGSMVIVTSSPPSKGTQAAGRSTAAPRRCKLYSTVVALLAAGSVQITTGGFYLNGQLLTFGPNDSGGPGYRVVRVPNL